MKYLPLLFSAAAICSASQVLAEVPQITPVPVEVIALDGSLSLGPSPSVFINTDATDRQRLFNAVKTAIPDALLADSQNGSNITLTLTEAIDGVVSPEGYSLEVVPEGVRIAATTPAGLFYGVQTLNQLVETGTPIPSLRITDEPRMEYRGMMLDVSRHFRDADFVKKQIDAIAPLKINRLHLHLTDAAGWRLEIKKYPELTDFTAWRPQDTWKDWNKHGAKYHSPEDTAAYGGYFTQDAMRDLISYAADRYITIIPEIEMPSHSHEVTATYPELSCTHIQYYQPDLCIGNEKTFEFLENVLDEVIELFPSHYIHIGGDEASKQAWKDCELCQARMKEEGLNNVDELQSYLVTRIEKYLNSKGRDLLGWDEIMEGGLAPNATVMSWRGTESGIKAALSGHKAIMSPGAYCYLDGYQDAPYSQPEAIGGYLPLNKVYGYDPVPDSLSAQVKPFITGIQGNLWCEFIPTAQHAEYMLYPRMIAIAEVGWSPQDRRDWNDFYPRALAWNDKLRDSGYHVFDLHNEIGNRPEAQEPTEHLGRGKKVIYNVPFWDTYPASGETTLTDGIRGGWNYNDQLWQGFLYKGDQRLDVTVDLEEPTDISYIGAQFMQICTPDVWMPANVVISVSDNGTDFTVLKEISHEQVKDDEVTFKYFDWEGSVKARYVRYQATSSHGVLFTDEIIVK